MGISIKDTSPAGKARDRAKARSIPDIGMRDRRSRGGTHGYSSGKVSKNSAEDGPPTEGNRSGGGRDSGSNGGRSGGGRSGGGREN